MLERLNRSMCLCDTRLDRKEHKAGHDSDTRCGVSVGPFFTTDTAAALRAIEVGADIVLKATKVDGIYSSDPNLDPDAEMYDSVSYDAMIEGKLQVMDANAIVLCRDQAMPIRVFNVFAEGNLMKLVMGEAIGSIIC